MRCLLLAATLCLALPAHASAPDLFGYGARSQALAGATVSDTRGHAAVYANPAGLAFERQTSVALGYQFTTLDLTLDGQAADARDATATMIGFDLPLPLGGWLEDRLALGAGFVIPTNSVLVADIPRPGDPDFVLVGNRAQTVSLQAALGVRIIDGLALGVGFIALSALDGAIDVAPNAEGRIGSQARDQLIADYSPIVGLMARLPAGFAVGAVWRAESAARFVLPITADLGGSFPLPIPTLQIEGVAQYDPERIDGELSWKSATWRAAAGASFARWSAYPIPIVYTAVPEDFPAQPTPDFEDIVEYRAGLEFTPTVGDAGLAARAGYRFAPTPTPEQTGLYSLLDSDRHLLTLGGGVEGWGLRLDIALQWHLMAERSHTKDADAIRATGYDPADMATGHTHDGQAFGAAIELGFDL